MVTSRVWLRFATVALCSAGAIATSLAPVKAEDILRQDNDLPPAQHTYTFEGKAEQAVTIVLESDEFDPVLSLQAPDGEEIAYNDDYGGTLNSTIIITLPTDGSYTVVTRSFSGSGGDYSLVVRDATPFEVAYNQAATLAQQQDYEAAIEAFGEAIAIDAEQPSAYLGRADAYLGQAYLTMGDRFTGPQDLPPLIRSALIRDFEAAADLIQAAGNDEWADSLREQANYLRTGELPVQPDAVEPAPNN
ncbi:Tetratricopeptide repeat domain protein [Halomicronema hongdechloris C2206]|uniref:Tetratricopeptide repeat domain protein n=1 Tax=Halomicronema hongdechloris C2206 TaxID=1641165 RepID=A0A1Z3HQD3_9CYAN|nr:tetratricopeptide repeat protein [Halomicronema hongdechloris]ASC72521.1 Tetratricopeptide repeat domain protein [Halomicronema hongdechloris C2206]